MGFRREICFVFHGLVTVSFSPDASITESQEKGVSDISMSPIPSACSICTEKILNENRTAKKED
jgi:hypothetical protein